MTTDTHEERVSFDEALARLTEIERVIEAEGGEIDERLDAELDAALGTVEEKVEFYAEAYRTRKANAEICAARIKALQERKKVWTNSAERIRRHVQWELERWNRPKIEAPTGIAFLQLESSPSIEPLDPSKVPPGIRNYSISARIDERAKEYLEGIGVWDELPLLGFKVVEGIDADAAKALLGDRMPTNAGTFNFPDLGLKVTRERSARIR